MRQTGISRRRVERWSSQTGFTLIELLVTTLVLSIIAAVTLAIVVRTTDAKSLGRDVLKAQQNARAAMDIMLTELRHAGYGVNGTARVPIEVASEYRLTFVQDSNRNGITDAGERITYFLDPDSTQTAATPNPHDRVLKRLESSAGDPLATPGPGKGTVLATFVTQRSQGSTTADVPLFIYRDGNGNQLIGGGTDPAGSAWGYTVPDSTLGLPIGGGFSPSIVSIDVTVVTESARSLRSSSDVYHQVTLASTTHPPNLTFSF